MSSSLRILVVGKSTDEIQALEKACGQHAEIEHALHWQNMPLRSVFDPDLVVLTSSLPFEEVASYLDQLEGLSRHLLVVEDTKDWSQLGRIEPLGVWSSKASIEEIRFRIAEAQRNLTAHQKARLDNSIAMKKQMWGLLSGADWKTGLDNRARFLQEMKKNLSRARRYQRPFCCLIAEIQHLEDLKVSLSEEALESLFEDLAGVLEMSIRDADVLARVAEQQFGLLLTETDLAYAHVVVERIQQRAKEYSQAQSLEVEVEFLFGLSSFSHKEATVFSMFEEALQQVEGQRFLNPLES